MNPSIKNKWLCALRGQDYVQGKYSLHDPESNTFCCLGVLTDIYMKETNDGYWDDDGEFRYGYHIISMDLPEPVVEWAALEDANPSVNGIELILLNDGDLDVSGAEQHSFVEIADLIEEYM